MLTCFACTNDDVFTLNDDSVVDFTEYGVNYDARGALLAIGNVKPGIFNFVDPSTACIKFDVLAQGEAISGVDMFISHNGGDKKLFENLSSFPRSYNIPLSEAASKAGVDFGNVALGDVFTFSFGDANTGSAAYKSGVTLDVEVSCPSALDGTYDAATTVTSQGAGIGWDDCDGNTWSGKIAFEQVSSGIYNLTTVGPTDEAWVDLSMGAYYACYNTNAADNLPNGSVMLQEKCEVLSFIGSSQWGEVFSFNKVEINGNDLTLGWTNDYGEGGVTVITNPDGWPTLRM